jgi:hypothetical protein
VGVAEAAGVAGGFVVLDPTGELQPAARPLSPRLSSLDGCRVVLLDISKPRGDVFLDRLESLLVDRVPGVSVTRYRKPTFTKNAPVDLRHEISVTCDVVIEALAD